MDFLQKLDFMMEKYSLNKRTLSQHSGIPYTTIDGWYKKGYEGMKLSTLRVLSDYFNTVIDFWVSDEITDPNAWKANGFIVNTEEMGHVQKYRLLDQYGKEAVNAVLEIEYKRYLEEMEAAEEIAPTSVMDLLDDRERLAVECLRCLNPGQRDMLLDQMLRLKESETTSQSSVSHPEADEKPQ